MKPLILLTHKYSDAHWGLGRSYFAESNYCRVLDRAGAVPVISAGGDPDALAAAMDGILFTGGGDIDPVRYGEENTHNIRSDAELDEMELLLFRSFYALKKPIFGICRGIQTINVGMGGTLIQDIPSQVTVSAHKPLAEGEKPRHTVTAVPGSAVCRLFGSEFRTNSYHHQAVKTCGAGLTPTAVTDDGVIEAVEHESLPIIGIQWHPERMAGEESFDLPDMMPLFRYFTELCITDAAKRKLK